MTAVSSCERATERRRRVALALARLPQPWTDYAILIAQGSDPDVVPLSRDLLVAVFFLVRVTVPEEGTALEALHRRLVGNLQGVPVLTIVGDNAVDVEFFTPGELAAELGNPL
jgi:hypothetical protein